MKQLLIGDAFIWDRQSAFLMCDDTLDGQRATLEAFGYDWALFRNDEGRPTGATFYSVEGRDALFKELVALRKETDQQEWRGCESLAELNAVAIAKGFPPIPPQARFIKNIGFLITVGLLSFLLGTLAYISAT